MFKSLFEYDIIGLNAFKRVCLSEYVTNMTYNKNSPQRGATTVVLKKFLSLDVRGVDTSILDQVWFQLRCVPGVTFAI